MPLPKDKIEQISLEVIKVLYSRFENYPEDNLKIRNAPFHEAFLRAFETRIKKKIKTDIPTFLSLSSWMHGLSGTLGQTFFENVAHILSNGEKRTYTKNKTWGRLKIRKSQKEAINTIMSNLSSKIAPNLDKENKAIFVSDSTKLENADEFTADVFFKRKKDIFAIELKTVQPNSNEMQGEKRKILHGKAALFREFPNHKIHFFIGFPFDPTNTASKTGFDKDRFIKSVVNLKKFFAKDEIKIASELWDFLSQEKNTMEEILKIVNSIATVDFVENYKFINDFQNRLKAHSKYAKLLKQWNLFSEIELQTDYIFETENEKFTKIYNKKIFKKGKYDNERFQELNSLISN